MTELTFISRFQPCYSENDYPTREWAIVGPEGAVQVWARKSTIGYFYGGVEYHTRSDHEGENCHLLDQPCIHDGSGLQFCSHITPNLLPGVEANNSWIEPFLRQRYAEYFK